LLGKLAMSTLPASIADWVEPCQYFTIGFTIS
jgi:hypothetical protein